MTLATLQGAVPILPTPLTEAGALDEPGLRALVRFCADREFDALVVLGSNGEFPYLCFEEKQRVMAVAVEAAEGRIPVIGSASACGTQEAVALARAAKSVGCAAVMAAVPLYFDPGLEALRRHLLAIAEQGELPIVYYHYPEVTGLVLPPPAFEMIAALPGVLAAKVTVVNDRFLRQVIERTRSSGLRVFAGTSCLLARCLEAGGAGAFCPLPLLAPVEAKALVAAFGRGDRAEARRMQARLLRLLPVLSGLSIASRFQAGAFRLLARAPYRPGRRPAPTQALLKEALRLKGHPITATIRSPLPPLTNEQRRLAARTLSEFDAGAARG